MALASVGIVSWLWIALLTVFVVWASALDPDPHIVWLYDWHVYAAGALDLIERELYTAPLAMPGWPLPVDTYNLPPVSAALALPFLVLQGEGAGIAWVAAGAVVWASAWWLVLRLAGIRHAWAWTGIALAAYSQLFYWWGANVLLGNINHLVLGLLVLFVLAFVRGRERTSGVLLGLAIATKLWPSVIVVPLARERRWTTIGWSIGTAFATTVLIVGWLGPSTILPMIAALRLEVPIEPGVAVLWTTAFRVALDWWPAWGGLAVGLVLLALPLRGMTALGVAMIAGISVIPNIWDHYLPTMLAAMILAVSGLRVSRRAEKPFSVASHQEMSATPNA